MAKELKNGIQCIKATSRDEWRNWLLNYHAKEQSVWLIIYKKESGQPTVYYPEAVDEALCFGWIDSKPNKRDELSYYQFFSKRNPKSLWSKVNKDKVERLMAAGLMHESGLMMVELAKQTGTWDALNDVDALKEPEDFLMLLNVNAKAQQYWNAFPPSARRGILEWILQAKTEATRQKRILETIKLAETNIRANQYTPKASFKDKK